VSVFGYQMRIAVGTRRENPPWVLTESDALRTSVAAWLTVVIHHLYLYQTPLRQTGNS
jgi:hypothetical protein